MGNIQSNTNTIQMKYITIIGIVMILLIFNVYADVIIPNQISNKIDINKYSEYPNKELNEIITGNWIFSGNVEFRNYTFVNYTIYNVSGNISEGGVNLSDKYLMVDTSNDPLTGDLDMGNNGLINVDDVEMIGDSKIYYDDISGNYLGWSNSDEFNLYSYSTITLNCNDNNFIADTDKTEIRGDVNNIYGDVYLDDEMGIGKSPPSSKLHVYENTVNTGSTTGVTIEQDGSGDAVLQLLLTTLKRWSINIDNSELDSFIIKEGSTPALSIKELGSTNKYQVNVNGNINVTGRSNLKEVNTTNITTRGKFYSTTESGDTTAIEIDGSTNEYTTAGGSTNFYSITRDFNRDHTSSQSVATDILLNFDGNWKDQTSGDWGGSGDYTKIYIGTKFAVSASGNQEATNTGAGSYSNTMEAARFAVDRSQTITHPSPDITTIGLKADVTSSIAYNKAGGTATHDLKGIEVSAYDTGYADAGTLNINSKGIDITYVGWFVGDNPSYGIYIDSIRGDDDWGFYLDDDADNYMGEDNSKTYFGSGKDAYITWDGSNMIFNTNVTTGVDDSTGFAYFTHNVSAPNYITRTSTFDKSKGNALDLIKDTDELKSNNKINHSAYYGYTTYEVTDYDNCWEELSEVVYCRTDTKETICQEELPKDMKNWEKFEGYKTKCGTKIEEGVSIDKEIDVLRQAVYDLKTELCVHNDKYEWC